MLTNFIVIILALFVFSGLEIGGDPVYSWQVNVFGFGLYYLLYSLIVALQLKYRLTRGVLPSFVKRSYLLRSISQHSILALIFYAALLYSLDIKSYLAFFPGETLKAVLGVAPFFLFLAVLWSLSFPFTRETGTSDSSLRLKYVITQARFNVPVVIPILIANICADSLFLLPSEVTEIILNNKWLQLLLIPLFLFILGTFLPVIVQFIWGCKLITDKEFLTFVDSVCKKAKVQINKIMTWPIMESHVITAGLMGIVSPFRYILLTPTIIKILTREEMTSVLAHELGHAKNRHLLFNLVLFAGFALFSALYPDLFFRMLYLSGGLSRFPEYLTDDYGLVMTSLFWGPIIISFILFFRYIFGYFSRNFERQADQFSLTLVGSPEPLVSALEKVAYINGIDKTAPNWHHFGISERIDALEQSAEKPELIVSHDKKVFRLKLLFSGVLVFLTILLVLSNLNPPDNAVKLDFVHGQVLQLLKENRRDPELHSLLANVMMEKKEFGEAMSAYSNVLKLDPDNVSALNNMAWLLVTCKQEELRDYNKGLIYAKKAFSLEKQPYIMDTLAEAYFMNGYVQKAIEIEEKALSLEKVEKSHYRNQLEKFKESSRLQVKKTP